MCGAFLANWPTREDSSSRGDLGSALGCHSGRFGGEELDSAAWKGAASRAVGARGDRQDPSGGSCPPDPPRFGRFVRF